MVRGVLTLALLGCGRIAFEPTTDAAPAGPPAFRDLCAFRQHTVIEDNLAPDDAVGAALAAALANGCGGAPVTARTVSQDDPGILDPATGRPLLARDDLALIGGGDGPQHAIKYLLADDFPVTWSGAAQVTFRERSTGRTLVTGNTSDSHDYALVVVVREHVGGVHVVSASGAVANGTAAAGYWFANDIATTITDNADGWTLVEWTNADADPQPSTGDTFVVIASGR